MQRINLAPHFIIRTCLFEQCLTRGIAIVEIMIDCLGASAIPFIRFVFLVATILAVAFLFLFSYLPSCFAVCVCFGISLESGFSHDREIYLLQGQALSLREPMRYHDNVLAVKEVEHSLVHMIQSDPELINAITLIVSFRPSKVMPKLG